MNQGERNPRQGPFRSNRVVSCGGDVVGAFGCVDDPADGRPEAVDGSLCGLARHGLQLGEGVPIGLKSGLSGGR